MAPTDQVLLTNDTRNWISFDVTVDVQGWLTDTTNLGWHIAKQNNNNNERIVFWSRESSQHRPRLVLFVSQDSSFRLARIIEPSVQGSISHPDTLLGAGTVVSYSFGAAAGHQNVQVTLDGQVIPANGTITMSQAHTLVASADRIVTVSAGDQALVQSARAVLLSSDPVTAFQDYLDEVETLVAGTSPQDAAARLDAIHFLAYDPILDSAALRLVDGALGGRMFTVGDTARADSITEGVSFIFVNGIRTPRADYVGNADYASLVSTLIKEMSPFDGDAFDIKFFYNRTYRAEGETPAEREARCAAMYARRRAFLGHVTEATFMGICALKNYANHDIAESLHQFVNTLRNNTATDIDANVLADSLQLHRTRGRHIILLAHSQGNLVSQEALLDLRGVYNYSEQTDSTCVAAVSLAAPHSEYSLPVDRTKGIKLEEDAVADWPWNNFDRVTNDSMLPLLARINSYRLVLPLLQGLAEAPIRVAILRLGIDIHGLGMYMIPTASRNRIKDDMKAAYKDCITHTVAINAPPDFTVLKNDSDSITAKVQNVAGRELKGRKIQWSSLDSAVVAVDSTGRVFGVESGVGRIVAANRQARDTVQVTILESCAGTGGVCHSWDPTHPCACV